MHGMGSLPCTSASRAPSNRLHAWHPAPQDPFFCVLVSPQVRHVLDEKALLNRLSPAKHPFLVNLRGAFQDVQCLHLVLDFVPGRCPACRDNIQLAAGSFAILSGWPGLLLSLPSSPFPSFNPQSAFHASLPCAGGEFFAFLRDFPTRMGRKCVQLHGPAVHSRPKSSLTQHLNECSRFLTEHHPSIMRAACAG